MPTSAPQKAAKKATKKAPAKKSATAKKAATKKAAAKKVPAKKSAVTPRELKTLLVLTNGKEVTHKVIAKATGHAKGNKLRELTAKGLVETLTREGVHGHIFVITAKGKKVVAAEKALAKKGGAK